MTKSRRFDPGCVVMPTVVNSYQLPNIDNRPRHIQDFEVVTKYYKCSNDEIDEMRELANRDKASSIIFYEDVAKQIRFWQRCDDVPRADVPRETINPDAYLEREG